MKSKYLVLVFLLISNFSNAWWEQTNGPYGGKINGLAIDGSNIVAATNYGVYVSTNNGSSWAVAFNNVATTGNILSLLVSGTNLFTGTAGGGVYVSANHGATWLPVNTGLPAGSQVNTLTVSGTTIFAGILGKGIYASNNNGATWTTANTGIPSTMTIYSIVVNGTALFAGSGSGGVYMSSNNGGSWTAVNTGLSSLSVTALVVSGTNIFAGTYDRGVFLSTNNGTSWTSVNSGPLIPFANITSFATIGTNIFAGTKSPDQGPSGVYHTANNGATWTEVNTGLTDVDIKSLAATGTDLFAGTNGGGVFRSINNGSNWFGASNGILHTDVRSLAVNGSFVIAATLGGGVFSSGNAGASWIPGNNGLGNSKILGMGVSGTTLLASPVYDGVYLSTNNGSTWTPTNLSGTPNTFRSFATSGSNMYAGGPTGVFLSTNGGSTWTAANNGLTSGWVNAVATLGSSVVFAGTDFGGIYRSTNNGSSWNTVNTGLIALNIYSLATSGSDIFAGGYGGVYLSKDSGNTWTQLFSVSGSVRSLAIDGTKLFAGGDYGVFVSTDYGNSWSNTGLGHYAMSLVIKGPYLFAGTFEHGIWKRLLCSSSVTQEVGLCNGQSIAVGTHLYDATGIYYDTLVNTGGCDSVVTTRLTVYATPGATIVAIGSPVICNGNSIVLRANTGTGLTYQWALNGVNIPGATSYSWSASVGGDYSCMVNNPCGSATSNTLTVTVNTIPSATISAGGSTAFCTGNSVSLNANTGIGISYQWKLNGTNIGGATSPAFLASAAGSYTCAVSNSCGSATSNAIVVTVDSAPTATITAGGPVIFCSGGSVALNANSGTGLSYQWKLNGVNIAGATSATHVAASAGSYTCAVTNSCGSVVSGSLVVTVNPLPTAIISTGGNPTFCTGGSVLLNANTGAGLTHQWNLNSVIIGGATASSYTALTAGSYTCVVTNSCGSTASNSIVVTVNSFPVMPGVIAGQATGICATSTNYSVGAVAGASFYSWTVPAGAVINSGQGTTNINVTYSIPFSSGTVSVTAGNTCGTSAASNRLVNAALLPTGPVSGNSAPCGNTRVIYSVPAVSGATNYTWTVPPKAKIISGQGTNSVDVRLNQYGGNITVRAGNACTTGTTAVLPITIISCTGNPNRSRTLDAMVFPNPASTAFSLQIHSTREESCWLVVTDMTGRLVEKNGPFAPGEQITFGSELTPGIYSAEVKQGEERKVLRVVKSE